MNRIIQQFSVLNKIRHKERLRQGTNFARCPTHLFNDQPIPNQNYLINKTQLSPYQQYLVDTKSLERPFTGNLWAEISTGFYHCRVCDMRLFTYNHKYNANTGYASFWRAIDNRVKVLDQTVSMDEVNRGKSKYQSNNPTHKRCECAGCSTHLGAVFFDGPPPTFLRYSINSQLLKFYDMPDFPNPIPSRKDKVRARRQKIVNYLK